MNTWLQNNASQGLLPQLRWTFSAGEPLHSDLIDLWRSVAPASEIVNLYGPTETTLAKCSYQVPREPSIGIQPIGQVLPQASVTIASDGMTIAGTGETGEIIIRTPYASLGYIDTNSAENNSFIKNPWSDTDDEWVYRSGDLGRLHPTGVIEIL